MMIVKAMEMANRMMMMMLTNDDNDDDDDIIYSGLIGVGTPPAGPAVLALARNLKRLIWPGFVIITST